MRPDERRKGRRTPVDFFVQVVQLPASPTDGAPANGEPVVLLPATDLSTTGIYLLASDDPGAVDAGRELDLEMTLPTGQLVKAPAQIAYLDDRAGQRGIGVEFSALAPEDFSAIERFVVASESTRRLG